MPRRWWQWVILLVLIWDWGRTTVPRLLTPDALLGSFDAFWWAGHCVISRRDIYSPPPNTTERNVYPPFHALLMAPIAILPKKVAFFLWQVGQLVVLIFCFWWMEKIGAFGASHREGRIWLSLLLVMPFLEHNFIWAQYNHWLLLTLLGFLLLLNRQRFLESGCLLGFIFSVKPFHLPLILFWLILKREWCTFLAFLLSAVTFTLLLPACIWGWHDAWSLLLRWHEKVAPNAFCVTTPCGGLPSTLFRLLTPVNVSLEPEKPLTVNFLTLPSPLVSGIMTILAVLLIILIVSECRQPLTMTNGLRTLYEMALVLTVSLLLSPRTEKHHCLLLLPTTFLTANGLMRTKGNRKALFFPMGIAGAIFVLRQLLPRSWREGIRLPYWWHAAVMLTYLIALLMVKPVEQTDSKEWQSDAGSNSDARNDSNDSGSVGAKRSRSTEMDDKRAGDAPF
jgi:hypothetical protein